MEALVAAVDQGTSSTRVLVFNAKTAEVISQHQVEIKQSFPKEGWVEEDPKEIMQSVHECIEKTCEKLSQLKVDISRVKAVGVTNQRETTLVWDRATGEPLYNAIVWLDLRTQSTVERLIKKAPGENKNHLKHLTGLPISTYFSAVKLRWLLDNVDEVREAVRTGRALFGTVDSWIIWNLTGGRSGGVHATDVSNASRTMLFNIHSMEWDPELCRYFDIPMEILPDVRSSSEVYGWMKSGKLAGVPISGCLGDQSAALVGQMCFEEGQAKNTYGTGCFLLQNTGCKPVMSNHGLLTTVAYKLGRHMPCCYALEGSVAIAGAVVQWLKNNMGMVQTSSEIEKLAAEVGTSHGCYFVPAFSGLYAPYWEPSARGIICGLTQFTNKKHLAFAALEAVCFQTREVILPPFSSLKPHLFGSVWKYSVTTSRAEIFPFGLKEQKKNQVLFLQILDAMNQDSGVPLTQLRVDGGMTANRLLMQLQADILCIPVVRPTMSETTALGAAVAAGAAEGVDVWSLSPGHLPLIKSESFQPQINLEESDFRFSRWKKAVQKAMNWETMETCSTSEDQLQ